MSGATSNPAPAHKRVLALYEPGRSGSAALEVASALVEREAAALTVLTIAPQVPAAGRSGCCGADARAYNQAAADASAEQLREARGRLGSTGDGAALKMLIEGSDPPLAEWIAAHPFDVVLLPARWRLFGRAKHPEAARLQASTSAEVRVIGAKTKRIRDLASQSGRPCCEPPCSDRSFAGRFLVVAPTEQPQVRDDERNDEVQGAPDPRERRGPAIEDHIGLVDRG